MREAFRQECTSRTRVKNVAQQYFETNTPIKTKQDARKTRRARFFGRSVLAVHELENIAQQYFETNTPIKTKQDARKTRRTRLFDRSVLAVHELEKRRATQYFEADSLFYFMLFPIS